jgi:hypothetical protein
MIITQLINLCIKHRCERLLTIMNPLPIGYLIGSGEGDRGAMYLMLLLEKL